MVSDVANDILTIDKDASDIIKAKHNLENITIKASEFICKNGICKSSISGLLHTDFMIEDNYTDEELDTLRDEFIKNRLESYGEALQKRAEKATTKGNAKEITVN